MERERLVLDPTRRLIPLRNGDGPIISCELAAELVGRFEDEDLNPKYAHYFAHHILAADFEHAPICPAATHPDLVLWMQEVVWAIEMVENARSRQ